MRLPFPAVSLRDNVAKVRVGWEVMGKDECPRGGCAITQTPSANKGLFRQDVEWQQKVRIHQVNGMDSGI